MSTFHIHISGIVQGVGFRPFICQMAAASGLKGWVRNGNDGVHIHLEAPRDVATAFYDAILGNPPQHALITHHHLSEIEAEYFEGFTIRESLHDLAPNILITPDIGLCPDCRNELRQTGNRRYGYAFTTCLHCGPRYSITRALPYDRINTTMASLDMCPDCATEYRNIQDRRHHSQTNSCPSCAILLHLYDREGHELPGKQTDILQAIADRILAEEVVAVKGTGGYLLLADATSNEAIRKLRQRKQRPAKPFALLYADRVMAENDARIREQEFQEMVSPAAPIVLCKFLGRSGTGLKQDLIAHGLDKIGIMLPSTPLLQLIADKLSRPLICTSANLSGSPIIHEDRVAISELPRFADRILTYDRDIVTPQDDSVVQFNESGQRIILRRSRGMAPNFFPQSLGDRTDTILAMGADMKGAFALHHRDKIFISQFLGDQSELRSQESHDSTRAHLCTLLHIEPTEVLTDAHPGYHSTMTGEGIAHEKKIARRSYQHHKAHFAAVLAEQYSLFENTPTLGFIWDGTGFGEDGNIWGGETFLLEHGQMKRVAQLEYFPQLLGDKMSREPRLSAFSLLRNMPEGLARIEKHFSSTEWAHYAHTSFFGRSPLKTSSMGRFLDGISALLTGCVLHRYEGEAVMVLEALARRVKTRMPGHYPMPLKQGALETGLLLSALVHDLGSNADPAAIADKLFRSLVRSIFMTAEYFGVRRLAFSGGVFQNALLTDMILEMATDDHELLFHAQLSPNDENIAFGQLALHSLAEKNAARAQERNVHDTILQTTNF